MRKSRKRSALRRIGVILDRYIEDLLVVSGLFFINFATFTLDITAGYYCLGLCLLGLGVWVYSHPKHKRGD